MVCQISRADSALRAQIDAARGRGGGPAAHGAVAALLGLLAAGLPGDAG